MALTPELRGYPVDPHAVRRARAERVARRTSGREAAWRRLLRPLRLAARA
jgi:hypothetical protein